MSPTRRDFLLTAAAAAAAAFARPSFARAWQGQQAMPVFTPLRRNIGYFTMQGGTIGYLVNSGGIAVIDSQFPEPAKAFLAGLKERAGDRPVDLLINTHHHGDHTGGNISFRGVAKKVVSQAKAAEHMHNPPGAQPPADQLYPDTTFTDSWSADVGDEKISAKFYSRAHTSGDVAITFERANVVHMGDLMFNQRHPVVDRAAGATLRGWMTAVKGAADDHARDTQYICGHANTGLPVVVTQADLVAFHAYLGAVLGFVEAQVKAGHARAEVMAMRDPLKGFESYGRFGAENPREILTCAYEEVTAGA
ncbi:MAG TPA: MBL fold metallo-hydrolase [Gemmatimonadaceae bacterium]|nr:MBL fold metallo-hydrolase [Gemmatimonadaceae bacterium]